MGRRLRLHWLRWRWPLRVQMTVSLTTAPFLRMRLSVRRGFPTIVAIHVSEILSLRIVMGCRSSAASGQNIRPIDVRLHRLFRFFLLHRWLAVISVAGCLFCRGVSPRPSYTGRDGCRANRAASRRKGSGMSGF